MPRIDAAMAESIRDALRSRNIMDTANGVKTSLSSWDGCMSASYCKWPVIVAIIIASLIVLSIIACIVRCACCGMSCCCECFSCLRCCGDCCGCCDPPNGRKHKHLDDQNYPPPPNQGYHPQPPMMAGGVGVHEPPKYAHFETGPTGHAIEPKKVSDDALPPMPSWDNAAKTKILVEEPGAVELGDLDPKTGQNMPLMSGAASPGAISPVHTPYGDRPGMHDQHSYMGGAAAAAAVGAGAFGAGAGAISMNGRGNGMSPYGQNGPNGSRPFNSASNDPYGEPGQSFNQNGPGRGQNYGNQFAQGPGNKFGPGGAAAGVYGNRPPPQNQYSNGSQRPLNPPQRQYSTDSQGPLMHSPSPTRPYPSDGLASMPYPSEPSAPYRGPSRMASPPHQDQGFDFIDHHAQEPMAMPMPFAGNGGRRPSGSRPGMYPGSTAPPSYASTSPPPRDQYGGGNGYESYPAPGERTRPPNSAGRGRQAEGWEVI